MKLFIVFLMALPLPSSAVSFCKISETGNNLDMFLKYLQETILSLVTKSDPEYLTISRDTGNETHLGAETMTLLKKVGQVSVKIIAFSRGGKVMLNMSHVVCNGKKSIQIAGYVKEMFSLGFEKKDFVDLKCPIEEVSKVK